MKKNLAVLIAVVAVISISGCATIIRGTSQNIAISSSPDNAYIEVYDKYGQKVADASTPATVRLKKGGGVYFGSAGYSVVISKEGYEKQTIEITSSISGWYIGGNLVLGGLIGWLIVDPMTGGMWTLKPKRINAGLRPSLSYDNGKNIDGIYIVLKEQIPEDAFTRLDLIRIK